MNTLFVFRENTHNIRNYQILSSNVRKTVRYGLETILYRPLSCGQTYHKSTNCKNF